jgi:hypothetical protein
MFSMILTSHPGHSREVLISFRIALRLNSVRLGLWSFLLSYCGTKRFGLTKYKEFLI